MKNAKAYIDGMGERSEVEQQLAEQTSQNHAVAVGVKQPLSTMPKAGEFLAFKNGSWIKVRRFKCPPQVAVDAVIDSITGHYWTPESWMPIS